MIYLLGVSQKELHTIAMRRRLTWILLILLAFISLYGWAIFTARVI